MTLQQWCSNGWLRPHTPSSQEIANLLGIVERDLADARSAISDDWRFGIAYNAALKLCTVLLYAEGFRAERSLQHVRTIQALPLILGPSRKNDAIYLDACRAKRNTVEYDCVGGASQADADELIEFVATFRDDVLAWLARAHPNLVPP
ncbi:MAG: hypothetical protein GXP31_12975 [Kiritimatiellaeota bacterium]|nr:hypothetical protein [Kiritimatiellota bacterium]